MAKLNFVHLCDKAFLSIEGKLNLIGIFKNINVPKFPAVHPQMTVVVNLDIDKSVNLKIRVQRKEAKEPLATMEVKLDPPKNEKGASEMGFISDFNNVKFEKSGEYEIEILIDNKPIEENIVSFSVEERKK